MNKKADWRNIAGGALNVGMGVGTALATDALLGYIPALKKRRGVRFLMSLGVGLPVTVFGNQIRSGMGDFWDSVTGKADLLKALNAQAANKAADREETAAALLRGDASPLSEGRGRDETTDQIATREANEQENEWMQQGQELDAYWEPKQVAKRTAKRERQQRAKQLSTDAGDAFNAGMQAIERQYQKALADAKRQNTPILTGAALPFASGSAASDTRSTAQKMFEDAETERLRKSWDTFSKNWDKSRKQYVGDSRQEYFNARNEAGY